MKTPALFQASGLSLQVRPMPVAAWAVWRGLLAATAAAIS
jgi:hypothetical protein